MAVDRIVPHSGGRPEKLNLACPYWLAYPGVVNASKCPTCAPSTNGSQKKFRDRFELLQHLEVHHRYPKDGPQNIPQSERRFYMTPDDWETVSSIVKNATRRPQDHTWHQVQMDSWYLPIWRVLIDKTIPEPKTLFYPTPDELHVRLTSVCEKTFKNIYKDLDLKSVSKETAESITHMISKSVAMAILCVPGWDSSVLQLASSLFRRKQFLVKPASNDVVPLENEPELSVSAYEVVFWRMGDPVWDGNSFLNVKLRCCSECKMAKVLTDYEMCYECTKEFITKHPRS
ncbi:hypothetical protein GGS23DRAFT_100976 [Durotheca rogersii]|uniref:uncharacterized protein n=1 Tax=Durotheca rogersii TaxID=419775 RepID=UPI00221EF8D4|nr:uncharacterized protein GGS23DRAFT_100976 [Durotheca rogersii]KAI5862450.1 hypothetical protein GGS23DRAFT_100976 [Durotheca rogersii]